MIDIELVESSIAELENSAMSYEQCRNLAALYSVRDNYYRKQRVPDETGSEFLKAVSGLHVPDVLGVMDEVMQAVRIMNTRTYEATIKRLNEIGDSL